jgi:flagellar motility protein MotE (MotC chaperone)
VSEPRDPRPGPLAERESSPPSPEQRNTMLRSAVLRPINVMILVIGVVFSVITTTWWLLPLTLATYASLVFLAARDPIFQRKVLGGNSSATLPPAATQSSEVSPERRARWLPRGETRQKVEATLEVYRKVVAAIEASDDVTRAVLDDAVPRLHAAADRLVDVAGARERADEVARELRQSTEATAGPTRLENLRQLEERIKTADDEISGTSEELLDLRAKVVRLSIDANNPARAKDLNASLDGLNARLEALSETMSPREEPPKPGG